jgi:glycolate oxidase iron-sulfur subunit
MSHKTPTMADLSTADRCVKCGLCLPHCPTFTLTGNEADSPRGRISLMQMVTTQNPDWSTGLFMHLDRCLQCRACEAMCPSQVPYGTLMDTVRSVIEPHRRRSAFDRWLRKTGLGIAASPRSWRWLGTLLNIYRTIGLKALVSRIPGAPRSLKRASALLPPPASRVTRPPHAETCTGTVSLFCGCAGSVFDQHTLNTTRALLQILGYQVLVPQKQTCCGALHQHNGDSETAARLMETNLRAFNPEFRIIGTASGCTAQLSEYGLATNHTAARAFAGQVTDILHFLLQQPLQSLSFAPLAEKVGVYVPCTQRNVLKRSADLADSLKYIPGIEPVVINPHGGCCGAAGSYMLSQPEFSDRLRSKVLDAIVSSETKKVVTSNIGCSLQIQAGLRELGLDIEVLHPVVLLQRQLA